MFSALLLLLLIGAASLLLLKCRRSALGLLAGALGLFWLAGSGLLAALLLGPLQAGAARLEHPAWGGRNVIVVLGAGVQRQAGRGEVRPGVLAHARILEALRLYRDCRASGRACLLLLSGGDPAGAGLSEARTCARALRELGVPPEDLLLETRSLNTFENARECGELLRGRQVDRLVLVTTAFHQHRALLYFAHHGLACEGSAADGLQPLPALLPRSQNLALADLALHEHLGLLRYRILTRLGWNAPPRKAGAA